MSWLRFGDEMLNLSLVRFLRPMQRSDNTWALGAALSDNTLVPFGSFDTQAEAIAMVDAIYQRLNEE